MLHIPVWRQVTVFLTVVVGLLLAMPNAFYTRVEQSNDARAIIAGGVSDDALAAQAAQWPSFLPSGLVNLGLDLRGGAHLLAEVQVADVYAARMEAMWPEVRDVLAAERETLEFLARHVPPGKSPMCGNSICQDRRFLARLMPELEAYFHYRNLDVSSIKELARRWAPEIAEAHEKDTGHQALADIRESIEELRYYRRFMGRLGGKGAEPIA